MTDTDGSQSYRPSTLNQPWISFARSACEKPVLHDTDVMCIAFEELIALSPIVVYCTVLEYVQSLPKRSHSRSSVCPVCTVHPESTDRVSSLLRPHGPRRNQKYESQPERLEGDRGRNERKDRVSEGRACEEDHGPTSCSFPSVDQREAVAAAALMNKLN
ncbi:uncharacterized protein BO66DRAFT_187399 [Aspergillus aculeatinus CBS 121060]|uniref:Uncharacterized protein n=1 Tax=Aspergillus aculeatinus CBS 121060 TaxID=1448322 RepID=A0ACD1GY45_9EURO|nr:hypothetical protein BO66DRAFT_187399 [Aspergillus aculeatinus CBS 121060]RAH66266.1 hypothetical protein BO66DRAFT_187399 [Aspergillus aculeatinus CBS 121060]